VGKGLLGLFSSSLLEGRGAEGQSRERTRRQGHGGKVIHALEMSVAETRRCGESSSPEVR